MEQLLPRASSCCFALHAHQTEKFWTLLVYSHLNWQSSLYHLKATMLLQQFILTWFELSKYANSFFPPSGRIYKRIEAYWVTVTEMNAAVASYRTIPHLKSLLRHLPAFLRVYSLHVSLVLSNVFKFQIKFLLLLCYLCLWKALGYFLVVVTSVRTTPLFQKLWHFPLV